jgi:FkbM family methyltransferase
MFEKLAFRLRHHPLLTQHGWLWNRIRPLYQKTIRTLYAKGLQRNLNGADKICLDPRLHGFPHEYEPEVWHHLMARLMPQDVFVDVGAFYGLYAVAVAKRLQSKGRVIAFEPSQENRDYLTTHIRLNQVEERVTVHPEAVSAQNGTVTFALQGSQSTILGTDAPIDTVMVSVPCVRLDTALANTHLDILKIDVEGFEEQVLHGAEALLANPTLRPHHIYIEIHSFAWGATGTTERSLLDLLNSYGYITTFLDGRPAQGLDTYYGEVVATHP